MAAPLHPQNVIALVWDFDKTLIPGYMQDPIFQEYGIEGVEFWHEVNALPAFLKRQGIKLLPDNAYLNHLLTYVQHGKMHGLTNAKLRELGARIKFHPGLPDFFRLLKDELAQVPEAERFELKLEHYIVSTGLREMIEGSAIRPFVEDIWASEFLENPPPPGYDPDATVNLEGHSQPSLFPASGISQIAVAYDNTSKTRALFEINKGINTNASLDVNATMKAEDRRVPFKHMIYIADGPSDVPAFSVMRQNSGIAFAVYDPSSQAMLEQVERLRKDGRIDHFGPADYRPESPTAQWLRLKVREIAKGIIREKREAFQARMGGVPRHLDH